ncbi:flavodoxin family protein [Selenihalanaerobacter shriftii]|uniref:Multimeric flavodoxin WrbA n=1 Tax=Selenihalanaerobacter shriftii TaxID=142842 RepID=A0A1T4MLD0_9FIRM|nr:flavodoxin family protein [Selenihalanaerobacter shriftii]SJZ67753.1 Multimeric flavodoxin WrbA [Selenihalanaerobacter shriftii]
MKVIGINGSPRKEWNTATLLTEALEGASSQGAKTELVHLYDLDYKGCISCFACKKINGNSYGKCALQDDLALVLEKIEEADAVIFASPVYFGRATGEMRSCLERLMFQYLVYDKEHSNLLDKEILTGFIYTMNVRQQQMEELGYEETFKSTERSLKRIFGASESLFVTNTYQFEDYSKYVTTMFDVEEKVKHREEEFPKDCKKAFEMGARFAK